MFADGTADEIGGSVGGPGKDESEEEEGAVHKTISLGDELQMTVEMQRAEVRLR